jgi:hypothetical protein
MADLNVERKEPTSPLPWILGVLVLLLLALGLWYLLRDRDETDVVGMPADTIADTMAIGTTPPPIAGGPAAAGAALQQFQQQCAGDGSAMSAGHAHIADCLNRIADLVDTVLTRPAAAGANARGELQEVRRRADALAQSPPGATDHAALASGAFTSVAALIERIQRDAYPQMSEQAVDLRARAVELRADGQLLEQRDAVTRFFDSAGEAVQGMLMQPAA